MEREVGDGARAAWYAHCSDARDGAERAVKKALHGALRDSARLGQCEDYDGAQVGCAVAAALNTLLLIIGLPSEEHDWSEQEPDPRHDLRAAGWRMAHPVYTARDNRDNVIAVPGGETDARAFAAASGFEVTESINGSRALAAAPTTPIEAP